jgi:hypothetical protein
MRGLLKVNEALCSECMDILRFSPKYGNDALGQAEYFSKLRGQGLSRMQIAERFFISPQLVDCRLRLWSAPEPTKKLLNQGKITLIQAIRGNYDKTLS